MVKKIVMLFAVIIFLWVSPTSFAATAKLPPNLIALSSSTGTTYFNRSYSSDYFWPLALQFVMQKNLAYCSIASSVMVLNALDVPAPIDPIYKPFNVFTQDNFFTPAIEKILPIALVNKQGATLAQISHALATFPITVKTIYANDITVEQFRKIARKVIDTKNGYIIVNFLRPALGEEGPGHMSPLAAYDLQSDRFLMLDVARYRYPSVWVKTQDLWNAMHTVDKDANAYRGLIIIQKSPS